MLMQMMRQLEDIVKTILKYCLSQQTNTDGETSFILWIHQRVGSRLLLIRKVIK